MVSILYTKFLMRMSKGRKQTFFDNENATMTIKYRPFKTIDFIFIVECIFKRQFYPIIEHFYKCL